MFRTRLPLIFKSLALVIFLGVGGWLVTSLIKKSNPNPPSLPKPPNLASHIVGDFNNFRYEHFENGRKRYVLTAAKDSVFDNSRHELEKVKLELYNDLQEVSGHVTSEHCSYDQAQALVHFEKNVVVNTADGLEVKSNTLSYNQTTGDAHSDEDVEFTRDRISGQSKGALLESATKRLEMKADVRIHVAPDPAKPADLPIDISGNWGEYTNTDRVVKLRGNARVSDPKKSLTAEAITAYLTEDKKIDHVESQGQSHFNDGVKTLTAATINAYMVNGKIEHINAQGQSRLSDPDRTLEANIINGYLTGDQLKLVEARGQSRLNSNTSSMLAKVVSQDMDFTFEAGKLIQAEAREAAQAETTDIGPGRRLIADKIHIVTVPGTAELEQVIATGHVDLQMDAPTPTDKVPNPVNKHLTTDELTLNYYPGGKFLKEALAEGHSLLTVTPSRLATGAERRILKADHSQLSFYETGNEAREFNGKGNVKITIEPYDLATKNGNLKPLRVTESDKVQTFFDEKTKDITLAKQEGNFKYEEGTRHAQSDYADYDATKQLIQLRQGKVVVWDEVGRTQADEIDLWTAKQESFGRGHVRTTYYSPNTLAQATPFRNMKAPVFITANALHSLNAKGEAVYTGEARAWQDDNFVRGDQLELYRDTKKMVAQGHVSSALYQAKQSVSSSPEKKVLPNKANNRPDSSATSTVPIFATSDSMYYADLDRISEYQGDVKMRQGTDSLQAMRVKIFLEDQSNEVKRLEAYEKVVLIQPDRRSEGDLAEYTAAEQETILTGNKARVVSQLQGTITGRRLTLHQGDDRILVDDQQNTRRVKTTHEVQR